MNISFNHLRTHLKKPIPLNMDMFCVFFWMITAPEYITNTKPLETGGLNMDIFCFFFWMITASEYITNTKPLETGGLDNDIYLVPPIFPCVYAYLPCCFVLVPLYGTFLSSVSQWFYQDFIVLPVSHFRFIWCKINTVPPISPFLVWIYIQAPKGIRTDLD